MAESADRDLRAWLRPELESMPGYEPIDILVRAEPGKVQIYEFQMQTSRMASTR